MEHAWSLKVAFTLETCRAQHMHSCSHSYSYSHSPFGVMKAVVHSVVNAVLCIQSPVTLSCCVSNPQQHSVVVVMDNLVPSVLNAVLCTQTPAATTAPLIALTAVLRIVGDDVW